ncbi:MAG: UDP-glucose--hexose-1-phosphate uridylyltransferase [Candidatus Borkfalkiaceae bacterium]|nr:UDP-glucose--hexose-1-phosphate uridylyltransferase [Christensenellaceae bacterium]
MVDGKLLTEKLVVYAKAFLYLNDLDEIYIRNTLLVLFKIPSPMKKVPDLSFIKEMSVPDVLFDEIKQYSVENSITDDDVQATLFASFVMGVVTQKPSEINQIFSNLREKMGAQAACDYFYRLCIMNNYIQKTAISRNLGWEYKDGDNVLEITVNLSKPEKDNKDIAKLLTQKQDGDRYPQCSLCAENEGFLGNYGFPPRANLRTVSVTVQGEEWKMQYSPYAYYSEHCIVFNTRHVPMNMNRKTILKLLDFIDVFPNYFVGSNSDLPIVGGSILNHEHFQGGRHEMPMHRALPLYTLSCEKFPDVEISVLNWYNSAIRLCGYNRNTLSEVAGDIVDAWKKYSDESVGVINSEEERHNSCTSIARYLPDGKYCVEIILRNNVTSEKYPGGVFHAHPEHHNIKKEGIGLIEAMGLFILPGRLKKELGQIAGILAKEIPFDAAKCVEGDPMFVHKDMIASLARELKSVPDRQKAEEAVREYVNRTCVAILGDTAVFKKTEAGLLAFRRFLNTLQIK